MKNENQKNIILTLMQNNKCSLETLADGINMQYANVADMLLGRRNISGNFFHKAIFFLSKTTRNV